MNRFELTEHDQYTIAAARKTLEAARSVDLLDGRAMARVIGRLEVSVERLIELVDVAPGGNAGVGHDTTGGVA
ncbi:hypothetical protein [Streptomyces pratensis]|uniref:hypothetical protein n=1 Tax=Streptomyces pratensis TaxID=1169025 RepID=UPI0019336192|nr:hypothetical protein [Streptomyces pratensis]